MKTQTGAGRRPGTSGTREAIAAVAARMFAEQGYDRTSLRAIALDAGVDPTLVSHFYGSKQRLFVAVTGLPFDPAVVIPQVIAGDRETVGLRVTRFLMGLLEAGESRQRVLGLIRSAATEPEAARMVRDLVSRQVLLPLVEALDADQAPLRATLLSAQFVGLTVTGYIVGIEPLASAPPEQVIAAIAPNVQRILTEPLGIGGED